MFPRVRALILLALAASSVSAQAPQLFPVSFEAPPTFDMGTGYALQTVSADFNNDQVTDIAVVKGFEEPFAHLDVYLGRRDRTFQLASTLGTTFGSIGIADFNGDGKLDIYLAHIGSGFADPQSKITMLLGHGDGTFEALADLPLADPVFPQFRLFPESIDTGDFNGDGHPDTAVVGAFVDTRGVEVSGGLFVSFGKGDGTFEPLRSITTVIYLTNAPNSLEVADLNGDGFDDLVYGPFSVTVIYMGGAQGTFEMKLDTYLGYHAGVGDVDGDGIADLAFPSFFVGNTIAFWHGRGDGTFEFVATYDPTFDDLGQVVIVDLDKDGARDVVVAGSETWSALGGASILYGNGDGTVQPRHLVFAGQQQTHPLIGDFNGDGQRDIAVESQNNLSMLYGTGARRFRLPPYLPSDVEPGSERLNPHFTITKVAVGDFNRDTHQDIVGIEFRLKPEPDPIFGGMVLYSAVVIWLGKGDGTFRAPTRQAVDGDGIVSLLLDDFNNDGKLDVVVGDTRNRYHMRSPIFLLLGNGDGTLQPPLTNVLGGGGLTTVGALAAGDINGDGSVDLLAPAGFMSSPLALINTGGLYQGPLGLGGPFEQQPLDLLPFGTSYGLMALEDIDRDGRPDLVMTTGTQQQRFTGIAFWRNQGSGSDTFQLIAGPYALTNPTLGYQPQSLVFTDFDRDGLPDALVSGYGANGAVFESIVFGGGIGSPNPAIAEFALHMGPPVNEPTPVFTQAADFNGDGIQDVAGVDIDTENASFMTGGEHWQSHATAMFNVLSPWEAAVGDFNEDDKPDVAVAMAWGVTLLMNDTPFAPDRTVPSIDNLAVDRAVLSPPDHRMVDVFVDYKVSDNRTDARYIATRLRATSNEPDNGLGDGDTPNDIRIVDAHHVRLRAERGGKGKGRVYTITVASTDRSGNTARREIRVTVPR